MIHVLVALRREVARLQCRGIGFDIRPLFILHVKRLRGGAGDRVDLPMGEREIVAVRAAHECRHLPPAVIGEVTDFIGLPEQAREPWGRASAQSCEHLHVQAHDGQRVRGFFAEHRAHGAEHVERFFRRHRVDIERVAEIHRIAVHHGHVQVAHGLEGAPKNIFGLPADFVGRLARIDVRAENHLIEIVNERAHEERVGYERRRTRGDASGRGEARSALLLRGEHDFHNPVAGVVEIPAADGDVVVQPGGCGWDDREQCGGHRLADEFPRVVW